MAKKKGSWGTLYKHAPSTTSFRKLAPYMSEGIRDCTLKPSGHVGSLSLSQFFLPFNSHEWPRQNFSLQYQHSIKQTSDENKEEYQLGDY